MPYLSHLFKGKISRIREKKIDKVLERFDACVITHTDPNGRHSGWIQSPNEGSPFDKRRAEEMTAALLRAGLYPIVP